MDKRITLKDVAQKAEVSYQTVSKVLNGQGTVTPETETRIKEIAQQLGYRPNVRARNLREQRSRLIGYLWDPTPPDIYNPILEKFLQSTIESAETEDYHLLTYAWQKSAFKLEDYENLIKTGRIDGLIISSVDFNDERVFRLMELNFPFVAFGKTNPDWDFAYVDVNGENGIYQVARHLLDLGHQRLGALGWPEHSRPGEERLRGYYSALQKNDIPIDPARVMRCEDRVAEAYRMTNQLLALPADRRPTALICMSDTLAIGAMNAVRDLGLIIGSDIAVSGFDDYPMTQYLQPSLTTVRQPIWEVGQKIIELLLQLINGKRPDPYQIVLEPQLIIRQSTGGMYSNDH